MGVKARPRYWGFQGGLEQHFEVLAVDPAVNHVARARTVWRAPESNDGKPQLLGWATRVTECPSSKKDALEQAIDASGAVSFEMLGLNSSDHVPRRPLVLVLEQQHARNRRGNVNHILALTLLTGAILKAMRDYQRWAEERQLETYIIPAFTDNQKGREGSVWSTASKKTTVNGMNVRPRETMLKERIFKGFDISKKALGARTERHYEDMLDAMGMAAWAAHGCPKGFL